MSDIKTLEEAMAEYKVAVAAPESVTQSTPEPEQSVTSESAGDVKEAVKADEVDDAGVPWKNRAKELERKLAKIESETASKVQELEQKFMRSQQLDESQALGLLGGSYVNAQQPTQYTPPQTAQAQSGYEEEGSQDPRQRPLTIAEFERRQLKYANDTATYQKFKEYLDRKDSPLVVEVTNRLRQKAQMGIDVRNDPFVASDVAAAAYGDLVRAGVINPLKENQRQQSEESRKRIVDQGSLPASGAGAAPAESGRRLSSIEQQAIQMFQNAGVKINDTEYLNRKKQIFGK